MSRDPSGGLRSRRVSGLTFCSVLALCACSSSPATTSAATGGSGAQAGSSGGGATAAGGNTGSSGTLGSGGTGGTAAAGSGGMTTGTAGTGGGGSSGAGGGGTGGTGGTGGGGAGGAGGGSSGTGGSQTGDCAGHALSLSANTTAGSDPAAAHVEVDLGSDLPIGSSNRTIELWAYMKTADWAANVNSLFFYGILSNNQAPGFGLDFGNTNNGVGSIDPFTNGVFDNDGQSSGVMVAMNQWVHFAMAWDGTSKSVLAYVNGVLKSTKVSSNSAVPTINTVRSPLTIGGYPLEGTGAYFADYIDEFRVWNVTRSVSDINSTMKKALVGNEAGLVGYWKFNEASGTTAADSVTTAGHTAHVGMLLGSPAATFGLPNPPSPVACP